jgi:Tol biopolymer transport system component
LIGFARITSRSPLLELTTTSGRVRSVAGGPITGFAWSPDGSRIVFARIEGPDEQKSPADLLFVKGFHYPSGVPVITDNAKTKIRDFQPSWSPDRVAIAFERSEHGIGSIYLVRPDGKHLGRLTSPPIVAGVQTSDYFPQWSPDASRVAFVRQRGELRDLYVINRDGTHEVALTTDGHASQGYSWAPDGRRVVFVRGDATSGDLVTIRPDGSDLQRLTTDGNPKFNPRWSPDGKHIVFTQGVFPQLDLFVVARDGGTPQRLTRESGREISPAWSQDSRYVAYLAFAPGFPNAGHTLQEPGRLEMASISSRRMTVLARGRGLSDFAIAWQPSTKGYPNADGFQSK